MRLNPFAPKDPPGVDRGRASGQQQDDSDDWGDYVADRIAWHEKQSERRVYTPRGRS